MALRIKNGQAIPTDEIPVVGIDQLWIEAISGIYKGYRCVQYFGRPDVDDPDEIVLTLVLADDSTKELLLSSARLYRNDGFDSISSEISATNLFEREIWEQLGVEPKGHPFLKPVRYEHNKTGHTGRLGDYPYLRIEGDGTHEVAVGPVHAGVIEPGSFRFLCHGENVYHLEIQLGYQHRGVEALMAGDRPLSKSHIVEAIAGDSTMAHTWAYAMAMESLTDTVVDDSVEIVRAVALELERIGMHLVGLAGISMDIGYLPGASFYGRLRTGIINTTLRICGSRFARGLIRPGRQFFQFDNALIDSILEAIGGLEKDIGKIDYLFFNSPGVLSRLERTGKVSTECAQDVGLVGIMAKMSGMPVDSRWSHPYGIYREIEVTPLIETSGDVYARAMIRKREIGQSIELIRAMLLKYPKVDIMQLERRLDSTLKPSQLVITMTEGWRGEVSHAVITDKYGKIERYKIVDPSFHNWLGLALAVRNNGISDFPLCNKSFDQSYCGHDL